MDKIATQQAVREMQNPSAANPHHFCTKCDKAFISAERLNHHLSRTHGTESAPPLTVKLSTENSLSLPDDPDMPVDLSADGIAKKTQSPTAGLGIGETPTPTRLLSALENNGIFNSTPFRNILATQDNPFGLAFRNGISSLKSNSNSKGHSSPLLSPSELNPILFTTPVSPMAIPIRLPNGEAGAESGGMIVWSPGGPFGLLRSPPVLLPAAGYMPTSSLGTGLSFINPLAQFQPVAMSKPVQMQQREPEKVTVKMEDIPVDIPTVTTAAVQKEAESSSSSSSRRANVEKSANSEDPNQQVREMLKRRVEEYLSENNSNSETQSVVSVDSAGQPPARRSRPILETDDPALNDKRRRNRLAAEKCRKRRKELRESLEKNNKDLELKFKLLSTKYSELRDATKQAIEELQAENQALRSENDILRSRVGLAGKAMSYTGFGAVKSGLILQAVSADSDHPVKSLRKNMAD